MINEHRFGRLEHKVDEVKQEVSDLKLEIAVFTNEVKKHVAGDEKIINEIVPVLDQLKHFLDQDLPKLREVLIEREVKAHNEKSKILLKTKWKLNLSLIGGALSILYTLYRMEILKF